MDEKEKMVKEILELLKGKSYEFCDELLREIRRTIAEKCVVTS
jgi:hypothetical protein